VLFYPFLSLIVSFAVSKNIIYKMNPESEPGEIIPPHRHDDGYLYVTLEARDGSVHTFRVDQLVWQIFRGQIPAGHYIDHIDGNLENNHLDNLRLLRR
jgi:hypothetical protein